MSQENQAKLRQYFLGFSVCGGFGGTCDKTTWGWPIPPLLTWECRAPWESET